MKLLTIDPKLIKKPDRVIATIDDFTSDQICQNMKNPEDKTEYFISTVNGTEKGDYIAVDNLSVLDAAIKAGLKEITIENYGKAHPLQTHFNMTNRKEIANPITAAVVMDIVKSEIKNPNLMPNSYVEKASKLALEGEIIPLLEDAINQIYKAGVRQAPTLVFFTALEKLGFEEQKMALETTMNICTNLKPRHFIWPTTNIFKVMNDDKQKSTPKIREPAAKKVVSLNCECGKSYSMINDEICVMEEKEGCLIVSDRVGEQNFLIPVIYKNLLGLEPGQTPKFSSWKNAADRKKLKFGSLGVVMFPPPEE